MAATGTRGSLSQSCVQDRFLFPHHRCVVHRILSHVHRCCRPLFVVHWHLTLFCLSPAISSMMWPCSLPQLGRKSAGRYALSPLFFFLKFRFADRVCCFGDGDGAGIGVGDAFGRRYNGSLRPTCPTFTWMEPRTGVRLT